MPLCRLCAQEIYDDDLAYLHEENSVDTTMIVDKINACLPISVSKTHIIKYILCILLDLVELMLKSVLLPLFLLFLYSFTLLVHDCVQLLMFSAILIWLTKCHYILT